MCLYPKLIINPKYKSNKKNGGIIPPLLDERTRYCPIGCSNCMECRKQYARNWQVRLQEDLKAHTNGKFVTFTLSNESVKELSAVIDERLKKSNLELDGYDYDNEIAILAVRRFLERYRKHNKKSLRHWLVTELGHSGTENIHLHGIIWTDKNLNEIESYWRYGFMWKGKQSRSFAKTTKADIKKVTSSLINYVNERTVNYITKYVTKQDEDHKYYKALVLTSPGIGACYMQRSDYKQNLYKGKNINTCYRNSKGYKIALPIYWRNKIYTEEQREKLWLHMLDKNERWVCGEKIKIDTEIGMKNYYRLLEYYQHKNIELGYGSDKKDWNKYEYERQRRNMLRKQRIENAGFARTQVILGPD